MFDFFKKIYSALSKTSSKLAEKITGLFSNPYDEDTFDKLEELFFEADLGTKTAQSFTKIVKDYLKKHPGFIAKNLMEHLQNEALKCLPEKDVIPSLEKSQVIIFVGVNGSGKTTSLAKLGTRFKAEGKSVLFGAADTFRAAAKEQLEIWGRKSGIEVVKGKENSDPSGVAFETVQKGVSLGIERILIDTAGRLQNKSELMRELEKVVRSATKARTGKAPDEIFLVLDATTGNNALDQARLFNEVAPLTGIILTKLDGSAKGGIILQLYQELHIPVRFVGVGESIDDLIPFNAQEYVRALFPSI